MSRPSHSEYVLQQLNSQREWGFLCDCCVVIGDIYFRAHRAVLTACSSYFRMLFIGQQQQQQQQQHAQAVPAQLSLNEAEVSADSFDLILQLMYLGRVMGQPSDFQQLRTAMSFLQLYYVPRSLEELREAGAPSSSSSSSSSSPPPPRPSGPAQGPMLFGVRMRGPATGGGVVARSAAVQVEREAESRPSSEVGPELEANQALGRLPSRKQGMNGWRFGRRYTCDRCGFVFSCERLLDEHSLTCGSCRALPGEARPVTTETGSQVEGPARPVVKTEPEDTAATGLGDLMVVEVHEEEEAAVAGVNEDEACGLGGREPGWTEDEEEEEGGEEVEGLKEETETEAGDGSLGPPCELCGVALPESQRADHYVSRHIESVCACGKCGCILVKGGRMREHAEHCLGDGQAGQASGLFSCHVCGVGFRRRRQLEEHMRKHRAGPAYRCPGCPLAFEEEGAWAEHMSACLLLQAGRPGPPLRNSHRKHVCQLCGKAFFQRCHLREHHATHTREKEFACHLCGKNFLRERLLRLHLDMHRGVARYVCSSCGQGTYRKQDHLRHLVSHLSAGQVVCDVCFQVLGGSQQLQRHMDLHLHTCSFCGDKFKHKKDLSNHHLTFHTKKGQ